MASPVTFRWTRSHTQARPRFTMCSESVRPEGAHLKAGHLEVAQLCVGFLRGGKLMKAVDEVSFNVAPGETLGLVGESGSGKTTIGRAILGLLPGANTVSSGTVHYGGVDLDTLSPGEMRRMRGRLQMIFQDPLSSFNPRRNVEDIVAEGLVIQGR